MLHGGLAATLLDTASDIAVHTALPMATGYTTAKMKIIYARAVLPGTKRPRADGTLVYIGRTMVTSEPRPVDIEIGQHHAHASTTCFLFPLQQGAGRLSQSE